MRLVTYVATILRLRDQQMTVRESLRDIPDEVRGVSQRFQVSRRNLPVSDLRKLYARSMYLVGRKIELGHGLRKPEGKGT